MLRTTVSRTQRLLDSEQSDRWIAWLAWDVETGHAHRLDVEVGELESLVRLRIPTGVPECGAIIAIDALPPEDGPYALGVWRSMATAPRNRLIDVVVADGSVHRVKWCGSVARYDALPRGWRPAAAANKPATHDGWRQPVTPPTRTTRRRRS